MNLPVPEGMDPKRFKILLIVIGVCGLLTLKGVAENLLTGSDVSLPPSSPQNQPEASSSLSHSSSPEKANKPKRAALDNLAALSTKNPFIDPALLPKQARGGAQAALPSIPQTAPAPVGNVPVPSIPNQPVRPPGETAGKPSLGVQGVLTGGKNGNMVIMSDGTVVTEGDTYQDQRIAYIGGDGVTFDNGHHLDYK